MRYSMRLITLFVLTLALAVPALAQTQQPGGAGGGSQSGGMGSMSQSGGTGGTSMSGGTGSMSHSGSMGDAGRSGMNIDPDKAYRLHEEFVSKTAELRGSIAAREAELELQLAKNPDDTDTIARLVADIVAMRGQLYMQATLLRVRLSKEMGIPLRKTRGLAHIIQMNLPLWHGHMFDHGKKWDDLDKEPGMEGGCKMMGKDKGMMGGMMGGMDMGKDKGAMDGMDMGKGGSMSGQNVYPGSQSRYLGNQDGSMGGQGGSGSSGGPGATNKTP